MEQALNPNKESLVNSMTSVPLWRQRVHFARLVVIVAHRADDFPPSAGHTAPSVTLEAMHLSLWLILGVLKLNILPGIMSSQNINILTWFPILTYRQIVFSPSDRQGC